MISFFILDIEICDRPEVCYFSSGVRHWTKLLFLARFQWSDQSALCVRPTIFLRSVGLCNSYLHRPLSQWARDSLWRHSCMCVLLSDFRPYSSKPYGPKSRTSSWCFFLFMTHGQRHSSFVQIIIWRQRLEAVWLISLNGSYDLHTFHISIKANSNVFLFPRIDWRSRDVSVLTTIGSIYQGCTIALSLSHHWRLLPSYYVC